MFTYTQYKKIGHSIKAAEMSL